MIVDYCILLFFFILKRQQRVQHERLKGDFRDSVSRYYSVQNVSNVKFPLLLSLPSWHDCCKMWIYLHLFSKLLWETNNVLTCFYNLCLLLSLVESGWKGKASGWLNRTITGDQKIVFQIFGLIASLPCGYCTCNNCEFSFSFINQHMFVFKKMNFYIRPSIIKLLATASFF